jgi:hypothetical protein
MHVGDSTFIFLIFVCAWWPLELAVSIMRNSSLKLFFTMFFRYRSHVENCRSCSVAYKGLNVLEVVLKVACIALIGIVAAAKQGAMSAAARTTLASMAVICYASSIWLAHFIYKKFHFHDYNHAFR